VKPQPSAGGSEERLIAWLRTLAARSPRRGRPQIGDDTATLPGGQVVTVDQQIEGVHFPDGLDCAVVARRLLAVNLSDLAASGARPRHAFLALAAPADFDHRTFFRALLRACAEHEVELAGGDLAIAERVHLSLTLFGERRPGDATLARDQARPGQRLWLGGTLGESALGLELVRRGARLRGSRVELPPRFSKRGDFRVAATCAVRRHLLPSAQIELGLWLARRGASAGIAAIDVSDGLAKDLHRLCAASGVGARLDAAALRAAGSRNLDLLAKALRLDRDRLLEGGGEDYVLLFSLPQDASPPRKFGALAIGSTTKERKILVEDPAGGVRLLAATGWDHFRAARPLLRSSNAGGAGRGGRSARRREN
jgi:thiamine-monophosphate kinase